MHFFSILAAVALASTVAAKSEVTCPALTKTRKCHAPAPQSPKLAHPKTKSGPLGHNVHHQGSHPKGKKAPRHPAPDTTSAKIPGVKSPVVDVTSGVYAIVNVHTGAKVLTAAKKSPVTLQFLTINLINGVGVATLTNEVTLVTLTSVELEGAAVASVVISAGVDIAAGLHLTGLLDAEARLQLGVGGVAPSESTCSPFFRAVACGIKPKDDSQRMVKRSLTGDVVGSAAELVVDAALKLQAVADLVVPGIGEVAASVCLVAEASVDAKVLALSSVKGSLDIDLTAFADVAALTFVLIAIDVEAAIAHGIPIPGIF
ncbi:BZ3500_MvSof-1268-A1-R1_Chr7-3g09635 [Microbotryum saponariae]|uniref:BZ3500_MvSof-1268-A1-R1_Chr7-3g09635 protein n=1 Tax=Microbotryum saponariae TaxID=289078 RepID=A0A2X0LB89_9BASI|nr:BZ3501_MvSof-1269-A2-R1_Chr7-2g09358 [Microbotryum saponariae]SDA02320.1 BZ3500_MvSof-1268-A1-R1_Chr7-3g09635 [Microbotryum saponariae]